MSPGKDGKVAERSPAAEPGNWFYNGGDLPAWHFMKTTYTVIIMLLALDTLVTSRVTSTLGIMAVLVLLTFCNIEMQDAENKSHSQL